MKRTAFAAEPQPATGRGYGQRVGRCLGALAAVALLAACGSGSGSAAKSGTHPTQTGSSHSGGQATACRSSDPAASISAASAAQNSASSYQLDNASSTQLGDTHLIVQVQQPDRYHFTAVTAGHTSEFLSIGHTVWMKSNGAWTVASPNLDLGSMVKQAGQLDAGILNGSTFTNPSVDPNARLGGQAAVLHKFHWSNPSAQLNMDVQLWLASDSCRPLQAIESFAQTSNGATSTGRSTTNWSEWDAVRIQAPA